MAILCIATYSAFLFISNASSSGAPKSLAESKVTSGVSSDQAAKLTTPRPESTPALEKEVKSTSDQKAKPEPRKTPIRETDGDKWDEFAKVIRQARTSMTAVADLKGVLVKQERIAGTLEPPVSIEIWQLSKPLCIYMKWLDGSTGREALFREASSPDAILAREGGAIGTVIPTVLLPKSEGLAMKFSNHSLDQLSLSYIELELRKYFSQGKKNPQSVLTIEDNLKVGEIDAQRIVIEHPTKTAEAPQGYSKVEIVLAKGDGFPLSWKKFGWPTETETLPLLENFELKDVKRNVGLSPSDFDPAQAHFGFGGEAKLDLKN